MGIYLKMVDFKYYLNRRDVKKQGKDRNLSKSLLNSALERLKHAQNTKEIKSEAKYIVEDCYDAVREAADSFLIKEGFKSYSHKATFIFLKENKIFNEEDYMKADKLRDIRNGIKYYAQEISLKQAIEAKKTANKLIKKLHQKIKQ
jgi:uncharacterized protein YutE (UPF0331/DUF86 family)